MILFIGEFSKVYLAKYRASSGTSQLVAVKKLKSKLPFTKAGVVEGHSFIFLHCCVSQL